MSLREAGTWCGGMSWPAVSVAVWRLRQRLKQNAKLAKICSQIETSMLNV
jgi:hypothetical protein